MNQRANGEGSIYRRADGRWTAACYVLRPDGSRVRRSVYGKTRKDVAEQLAILIIALYRTREESVERVHDLLARHSVASEAEPGCRRFSVHQGMDDPTCFALYEEYDDPAAFDAHRKSAHFRNNIEGTLAPLLVERVWRRFRPQ